MLRTRKHRASDGNAADISSREKQADIERKDTPTLQARKGVSNLNSRLTLSSETGGTVRVSPQKPAQNKLFLEDAPTVELSLEQARAMHVANKVFLEDEPTVDMTLDEARAAYAANLTLSDSDDEDGEIESNQWNGMLRSEVGSEVVGRVTTLKTNNVTKYKLDTQIQNGGEHSGWWVSSVKADNNLGSGPGLVVLSDIPGGGTFLAEQDNLARNLRTRKLQQAQLEAVVTASEEANKDAKNGRMAQAFFQSQSKVCSGCGSRAFADATFCTDCGEDLPVATGELTALTSIISSDPSTAV
jgi:hypothetical protein